MTEPILIDNPNRFVLFPIKHHDLWDLYNQQKICYVDSRRIRLIKDIDNKKTINR